MNPINRPANATSPILVLSLAFIFLTGVAHAQPATGTVAANFVGFDNSSQGNWQGKYGTDGYSLAGDAPMIPSYASLAVQNQSNWTWTESTTDPRALVSANTSARMATTWYNSPTFSLDVNLTDGRSHQIAIYALDWDYRSRSETIQILDANSGALLNAHSISSFASGIYIIWNVSGHVIINLTSTGGPNAVVSGIFFDPSSNPVARNTATVNFGSLDPTTQGHWQTAYGTDGYSIANNAQTLPTYASFATQNQSNWTWAASTTDPRALLSANSSARMATTWYNNPTFGLDVNLTDGQSHEVALYTLDWDYGSRSETIQIVDANSGAVLDARSVSSFTSGVYLVWNISGHVVIYVRSTGGPNAVVSGIFFSGASHASAAIAPAITAQPASQTIGVGQSATFSVADTGSAPLTYQWMKNGMAINGATSASYTTSAAAASDNASQFSVVVSNSAGRATSTAAMLTVKGGTLIVNASSTSLSFGSVSVLSSSTKTATLTNTGTANVTISNVTVSGAGFNASGIPAGSILAPGQTATLSAAFAPAVSGNATGSITVSSNATSGANVIALSGVAVAPVTHAVSLSWSPSTSAVVGYNVYVSTVSGSQYTKLTASPTPTVGYVDSGLATGQTRYYVVTSVNSSNEESGYSSEVAAIVP